MTVKNLKKQTEGNISSVIVVVDGDISHLYRLKNALSQDYTVLTTTGGIEALRLIKNLNTLDVLVISHDLTGINGKKILRFVQESIPRSKFIIKILIMDSSDDKTMYDSAEIGWIDAILIKPVSPERIKREIAYLLARMSKEKRSVMRFSLEEAAMILVDDELNTETELVDISENGMFLKTLSLYPREATLPFKIILPDGKEYALSGRIVRTDKQKGGIGVKFISMDERSRNSLMHSLVDCITLKDLAKLKARYPFLKTDDMVPFTDKSKIENFLREAMKCEAEIVALQAQLLGHEILTMIRINPLQSCTLKGLDLDIRFKTSDLLFISFQLGYATYNFETMVYRISADGKQMECLYPRIIFYSEKRIEERINPDGDVRIEIPLPSPYEGSLTGRIVDISPGGVSFITDRETHMLLKGTPIDTIRICDGDNLLWEENGEVRHVTLDGDDCSRQIRYGIQFGIARMSIKSAQLPSFDYGGSSSSSKSGHLLPEMILPANRSELGRKPPEVIRVENKNGEEIVGILNSSLPLDEKPIPVVLMPPAFGKTKETLFGLALTLIENFYLLGKPIAVIRYDGIRRKGESHKDPEASEPPYEMVNADFTQGASDIKTIIDWLDTNPRLRASSITLVSFSLSALEARIALRDEDLRRGVSYWIACMGTPEFRDLMTRINCGLDFFEQHKLGIKLGIMPVLGNLVNVDPYVADGIANSVATIEQAKEDMRHFDIPITWIYGQYDKWVKTELVREIMSVHVDSHREVISVPTGHNARTSKEALNLFGNITSLVYRFLHNKIIQPVLPSKQSLEILRRGERDRLPPRKLKDRRAYWQQYLIGEENFLGFDIMGMSDDYQKLLQDQVESLELMPEDRLLDLGGGTGIFVEHLLEHNHTLPAQITIADLILEALKKAHMKLSKYSEINGEKKWLDLMCLDLEFNRFLPVRRFLNGEISSFVELADRIEGMTLESAMIIQNSYSPRLHRIFRGETIDSALDDWLRSQFDVHEYRVIIDFNHAVRYVRRRIKRKPLFQRLVFPGDLNTHFHLPVKTGYYNKILMSLVLSYLFNPTETLFEVRRIIKPGGRLVLSSMRPDTDASGPFTRLMEKIECMPAEALPSEWNKPRLLDSLRAFLNDAQALVDLEEAGTFDFFDLEKLENLLEETGWDIVRTVPTFGDPPQGFVLITQARDTNGKERSIL